MKNGLFIFLLLIYLHFNFCVHLTSKDILNNEIITYQLKPKNNNMNYILLSLKNQTTTQSTQIFGSQTLIHETLMRKSVI
jgi:hypothetical protein